MDKELQQSIAQWHREQERSRRIEGIVCNTFIGFCGLLVVYTIAMWATI
jgi:hypothetical protein